MLPTTGVADMGQLTEVGHQILGSVALFYLDGALAGPGGEAYLTREAAGDGRGKGARMAHDLFIADPQVVYVFIDSSGIAIERPGGWDDTALDRARGVIGSHTVEADGAASPAPSPVVEPAGPLGAPGLSPDEAEELRSQHYNATITDILAVHSELWIIRVEPDEPRTPPEPGKYATLALGYWEPRVDEHFESLDANQIRKLARRSYSVSSSILDPDGRLLEPSGDVLEFYLVLVRGDDPLHLPALTPRLFGKHPGDRIFLGAKLAGRYTLQGVPDDADVVFMATGTGEAPHNLMILDLLRRGHQGRILSVCSARYHRDLAYLDTHRRLEASYPNYHFLAITTREGGPKTYIQDLIRTGRLEEELGAPLHPERTHCFLCGNPAMIGLPSFEGDTPVFPTPEGAVELLVKQGFTLNRPKSPGTIHYEEYW